MRSKLSFASALLASAQMPVALGQLNIDINNADTLKTAAATVMKSMVNDYTSQQPFSVGLLPPEYSFFESALFFNTIMDYAAYTGDSTYNSLFEKDFFAQVGSDSDFMPSNSSQRIDNDDVGYWALAAMTAAEFGAKPANSSNPSYLSLATKVFNNYVSRWDTTACNGGLRWQITSSTNGYEFKDTQSNGIFFELSARLGAYTGNKTYTDWATKIFDWTSKTGLTDAESSSGGGVVYAGVTATGGCKNIDKSFFSAQSANYIYGSAAMYNTTKSKTWLTRATLLAGYASATYFGPQMYVDDGSSQVVVETACEFQGNCTLSQKAGKNILFRSLANAITLNAGTNISSIMPRQLNNSATAAGKSCSDQGECAFKWSDLAYNPAQTSGFGEKTAAIEAWLTILRRANGTPDLAAAQSSTPPSTTSGGGASSTGGPAPTVTQSGKPNSGATLMAGSALGLVAVVSFLQALL
ncbi:hydrolase 76 protein [Orbilia ellipsospora]|uniref:Mannan endo-1,6-alpha-mannosidase n=1 Tax=Orbilia ellipsospora TaxID=2528407 RepID=A0AAV9XPV7_9PEZI